MKTKSRIIVGALLVIALCVSIIAGTTFALFTSEDKVNVAITSGKVDVKASLGGLQTKQLNDAEYTDETSAFGGEASIDGQSLVLNNFVPGDGAKFNVDIVNNSTVGVKYRIKMSTNVLTDGNKARALSLARLNVTFGSVKQVGYESVSEWTDLVGERVSVPVTVELDREAGDEAKGRAITLYYVVEAVQANGVEIEANVIETADDLVALSNRVSGGDDCANKVITLAEDIDMSGVEFNPIGTSDNMFCGIFNGNGHTIRNLTVNKQINGVGLFGYVHGNAVIRDLTVENASISGIDNVGAVVGNLMISKDYSKLQSVVYNVNVVDSVVSGGHYVGGIAGHSFGLILNSSVKGGSVKAAPYYTVSGLDNGDKVGGLVGMQQDASLIGNSVNGVTVEGVRDLGALAGHIAMTNNNVFVVEYSQNTVDNVIVNHAVYEELGSVTLNKGDICGRKPTGVCSDGGVQNTEFHGMAFADIFDNYRTHNNVVGNVIYGEADSSALDGVICISDVKSLQQLAVNVNGGDNYRGKTVILINDIDLAGIDWTPIGIEGHAFSGTFDGNNRTVSNLKVVREGYAGLFGYIDSAAIKNVNIHNAEVKGRTEVGAVVGDAYTGIVENCHVTGLVKASGSWHVGGLAGYGYASFNNCSVHADQGSLVEGVYLQSDLEGDAIGGLVGYMAEKSGEYRNLSVSGLTVRGTRKVGGLVGQLGTYDRTLSGVDVSNVVVESVASAEYVAANSGKIFFGGVLGECTSGTSVVLKGAVSNVTVIGVEEGHTGVVAGGSRSAITIAVDEVAVTDCESRIK